MSFSSYQKYINEKFTEDSDPVTDMGIGIKYLLKKEYDKLSEKNLDVPSYLFGDKHAYYATECVHEIIEFLLSRDNFNNIKLPLKYRQSLSDYGIKIIKEYFKDKFDLTIIIDKKVNEKFTEDSDPITDMGIGTKYLVEKWLKDFEEKYCRGRLSFYTENIRINEDGTIDADMFNMAWRDIKKVPKYIKFNNIKYHFSCCFDFETIKNNGPKKVGTNYNIYTTDHSLTHADVRKICKCKHITLVHI
jgi:hypothetical protein